MPFHMALWKTGLIKMVSLMSSSIIKYISTVTSDFFNIFELITDDILGQVFLSNIKISEQLTGFKLVN